MIQNICTFIPKKSTTENLHTLHFVLETLPQTNQEQRLSIARMHYVLNGEGTLKTRYGEYHLKPGDVFFCLPAMPFSLQSGKDFQYMYIGYFGPKGNQLLEHCKINEQHCVCENYIELKPLWEHALPVPTEYASLRAESVLLYTFSAIGARRSNNKKSVLSSSAARVKKYIDEHFTDCNLSLAYICQALSYTPKYVSARFKQEFQIGINEYVNKLRIQHACMLIHNGFTFIKDISFLCGYNDPLYFSKIFKATMKCCPREYIANHHP